MRKYAIDIRARRRERIALMVKYLSRFLRFLCYRATGLKVAGPSFIGPGLVLENSKRFEAKRGLSIGRNVSISCYVADKISFGESCTLKDEVIISGAGVLSQFGEGMAVGDGVGFSERVTIFVRGRIEIGDNTIIGPNSQIISENHSFGLARTPVRLQPTTRKGIRIGRNVWIGAGVVILDGTEIGDNCIVAAGAVVTASFDGGCIVGGVPARLIKRIGEG